MIGSNNDDSGSAAENDNHAFERRGGARSAFSPADTLNLAIGVIALLLGGISFYYQFVREARKLTATVDGLNINADGTYRANVLFRNDGTEHEIILLASYALTCAGRLPLDEKHIYITGFLVLAPGEVKHFPLEGTVQARELPHCDERGLYRYWFRVQALSPPQGLYLTYRRVGDFRFDGMGYHSPLPDILPSVDLLASTPQQMFDRLLRDVEREIRTEQNENAAVK